MNDEKNKKLTFLEWLGFKRSLDFSDAKWLGPIFGVFILLLIFILFIATIITLFGFLQAGLRTGPYSGDSDGSAIRNIGLVLAALIGSPFIIWRATVAARQVKTSEESLLNDKINSASNGLRARREISRTVNQNNTEVILRELEDDIVTRVAAIDRLEGLVAENKTVAPRIAKLLAIYIRGNFPTQNLIPTEGTVRRATPRIDLQRAVDAIGRIMEHAVKVDPSNWRLDLKSCNFDGVDFSNRYFRAANLSMCRLEGAILNDANFEGAYFFGSLLNYGAFFSTNLRGAKLENIVLNRPEPLPGGFVSSINMADLHGVSFKSADIRALDYLGEANEISKTFATNDTQISNAIRSNMLVANEHRTAHSLRSVGRRRELNASQLDRVSALETTGFQHWSPYDASDGSTGFLRQNFYKELEMNHWPFYSL